MPIRQLPDGSYEIDYGDGAPYRVPEEIARRDFPEQFPDMYAPEDPVLPQPYWGGPVEEPEPEMEAPPWLQEADPYDTSAADAIAQEQLEAAQEPVETFAFPEDEAGPSPAQRGVRSVSASREWTGPYKEAQQVRGAGLPDFTPEQRMAEKAYQDRVGTIDATREGMAHTLAAQQDLYGRQAEQREETVAEQQRMHEESMQEVQRREEELEQAMSQISRMDMGKVWGDIGQSGRIAGFIAAGIAGFLNPGGDNSVIAQMQQMADMSAREQAANIKLEQERVRGMGAALSRYEARAGRDEELYLTQRALLEKSIVDQISFEQQKYQSVITLGNLEMMKSQALENLANTTMQRRQKIYENDFNNRQFRWQQRNAAANRAAAAARNKESLAMRQKELDAKLQKGAAEQPYLIEPETGKKVYLDVQQWGDKSPADKEKFKNKLMANHDVAEALRNLDDTVQQVGEIYGGVGKLSDLSPDQEGYAAIEAARQRVIQVVGFAEGGKALTGPEMAVFTKQMGPIDTWLKGTDNTKRHRLMMDAVKRANRRLYMSVGAKSVEEVSPAWKPGDLSPAQYGVVPYEGAPGQFRMSEPGEAEKSLIEEDIDLLEAQVKEMQGTSGVFAESMAAELADQYEMILDKYSAGKYSVDTADETAKRVSDILGRIPEDLRPQSASPFGGQRDVALDFKSYGAEGKGVRAAIEAIQNDDELGHRMIMERIASRGPWTLDEFNKAREMMGLPKATKMGF